LLPLIKREDAFVDANQISFKVKLTSATVIKSPVPVYTNLSSCLLLPIIEMPSAEATNLLLHVTEPIT